MYIQQLNQVTPFETPAGETIRELTSAAVDSSAKQSIAHISMAPNAISKKHYHPIVQESYFILKGNARLEVDNDIKEVHAGDLVIVAPRQKHKITNLSATESLEFLATCVPAWTPDCSVFEE